MSELRKAEPANQKEMFSFCLVLFSDIGDMHSLWLPAVPSGFFRFSANPELHFLSIEEKEGCWVARCSAPAYFQNDELSTSRDMILDKCQLAEVECEERHYSLYIQPVSCEQMAFRNYTMVSNTEIRVGSQEECDICYRNAFCRGHHATLQRSGDVWQIRAASEDAAVYVNDRRVTQAELHLGDIVFLMGLRMIVGSNYLAINGNDGSVTVSSRVVRDSFSLGSYFRYSGQPTASRPEKFFHRLPRRRLELEEKTISVEGPPMSMEHAQMPLMLRMGSSMVMGGAAAMAGNFTTLLSSVLFPLLSSKYTDKQKREYEACRVSKYHEYLDAKRLEIAEAGQEEHRVLNQKFPALDDAVTQALEQQHLWERRPIDTDFLTLRLGSGNLPLRTEIQYPERRFSLDSDPLEEEMYQLVEAEHILSDMPITLSVTENISCGLLGPRQLTLPFLRQLMLQTAIFHSYDEVKMVFLASPDELEQLEDIRFLPHVWDDQQSIRFVATNEAEAYRIGEYLKDQLPENPGDDKDLHQILKKRPYYLIFALDKKLFDSHEILKSILQSDQPHGMSVVCVYDNLPKECQKIIRLGDDGQHRLVSLEQNGGHDIAFSADNCSEERVAQTMRMLANTKLKAVAQEQALPKMITFLEMLGAGTVEQLNAAKRWQENNPVSSLSAPVGVGPDGSWFTLDLHEKRQGPHGLVAGMTGSGKSEFLISYILSMAVNYHPNEVAFVLIDYKGGGLAGAFENPVTGVKLPHLVGTITNLDGSTIQRSLMSIESELRRRQRVFNEVKSQLNEGTMDIYAYQKLYRAGKISEPMPHLFIISDEFAELKQQQPEFIEKLISAARIGRSLGVHLILATQKPSGVVNDQIRSNTKFRVCLRVQERSDSMDMLKRPEAAELTDTGRFYLQVGYNEYFAMGQSAWCGAAYEPQTVIKKQRDDAVEFLDITGQTVAKAKPKGRKVKTDTTQLVAVVKYLSDLAEKEGFVAQSLWLDELPSRISLTDLDQRFGKLNTDIIRARLGFVDDPAHQLQFPLDLDLQHNRNLLIVGETGSGKTTLLQTLLFGLSKDYSSERVNFYILDFSSRLLKQFEKLPHCGGVITDDSEDAILQLLSLIKEIISERRKLFTEANVSNYDSYLEIAPLPLILLIIDDASQFEEMKKRNEMLSALEDIMSNGVGYGVRVVFTFSQINVCPMRLRRNAGSKLALRARDRFVYSDILDQKCQYMPTETPGRGMCAIGDGACEYQAALATGSLDESKRLSQFREKLAEIVQKAENKAIAKRIVTFDENQTYQEFSQFFQPDRLPLGIRLSDMKKVAIPLQQLKTISLYFGNELCTIPVLKNLIWAMLRENAEIIFINRSRNSVFPPESEMFFSKNITFLDGSEDSITAMLSSLSEKVKNRKQYRDQYCAEHRISDYNETEAVQQWRKFLRKNTQAVFVLFESLADLATQIKIETAGMLGAYFQACYGYNIYFIACTYPDDDEIIHHAKYPHGEELSTIDESSEEYLRGKEIRHIWEGLCSTINPEKFVLLFGGQNDKQKLLVLPATWSNIKNPCSASNIDKFLLHYHGDLHCLSMPCEKVSDMSPDIDEQPIV